jgi:hypothetical protein
MTLRRALIAIILVQVALGQVQAAKPELKFRREGTFKIVQFSDIQDGAKLDPRATALMDKILDTEQPDFVVVTGDCIAGYAIKSADEVRQAIACVAAPMEKRKIAWAITFGNHDAEHQPKSKLGKEDMIRIYQSYPCNLNVRGEKKIHGVGNTDLLVKGKDGNPAFCLWLIDSNMYAPKAVGPYDWIHTDQVNWYVKTSEGLEARYGHRIPGIMYFHIPIREFIDMVKDGKAVGDRREDEGCAKINSGLLAAVVDRGDVNGIFCGHEHTNNYVGEWMGVRLGYDAAIGYASYNVKDGDPTIGTGHGGRVMLLA